MKLVKRQINGNERLVLMESASLEDLTSEAARLKQVLGYEVHLDERHGHYLVTHGHYRGKFVLVLEPD